MAKCAIVAIPRENSSVWKVSSEKVPHMTLLFLGDLPADADEKLMTEFVEHVAQNSAEPFGMEVKDRGILGDDKADVLFFNMNNVIGSRLEGLRSYLLSNSEIRKHYDSTEQYPEWTPHLTLGYPKTPATKPEEMYDDELGWISFDRLAIWFEEDSGPSFKLEYSDRGELAEVAMFDDAEDVLQHFGVKGMRWGRRKSVVPTEVTVSAEPGRRAKATGGTGQRASEDAQRTAVYKQKAKASTTDSLSTKELQELVNRMNLEQQYSRLANPQNGNNKSIIKMGMDFVKSASETKTNADKILGDEYLNGEVTKMAREAGFNKFAAYAASKVVKPKK